MEEMHGTRKTPCFRVWTPGFTNCKVFQLRILAVAVQPRLSKVSVFVYLVKVEYPLHMDEIVKLNAQKINMLRQKSWYFACYPGSQPKTIGCL